MKLTPMDIHNKEFNVRLHGFDQKQVDEFLDEVINSYSDALDQITDLQNQIRQLQNNPASSNVNNEKPNTESDSTAASEQAAEILVAAQNSANAVLENANKEAARIMSEAENFAAEQKEQIVESGNGEQQAELQRNISVLADDYLRLKQRVTDFREKTKMLLSKELEDLDDENWQYWLDRYYGTERLYPVEGEPIEAQTDIKVQEEQEDSTNDVQQEEPKPEDTSSLDTKVDDEVDLDKTVVPEADGEAIATGDNPTNVAVNNVPTNNLPTPGTTIVFPEKKDN